MPRKHAQIDQASADRVAPRRRMKEEPFVYHLELYGFTITNQADGPNPKKYRFIVANPLGKVKNGSLCLIALKGENRPSVRTILFQFGNVLIAPEEDIAHARAVHYGDVRIVHPIVQDAVIRDARYV